MLSIIKDMMVPLVHNHFVLQRALLNIILMVKNNFKTCKPLPEDLTNYPIIELTLSTLYKSSCGDCSWRRHTYNHTEIAQCRACLGYPTFTVSKDTLENTTLMVKTLGAETQEYLRDYHKTQVHSLRPEVINEVTYIDTFFLSIVSIGG